MTIVWRVSLFGLLLSLLLIGCGKSIATADVSGQITYNGKPLAAEGMTISFVSAEGRVVSAKLGSDGTYRATGVEVGENFVGFTPGQASQTTNTKGSWRMDQDPRQKIKDRQTEEKESHKVSKQSQITQKYRDPLNSGVKTVIVAGENKFDYDIK